MKSNQPPNIVFVLTDDQGYGDLGFSGNPWIKTPHIDQFARESVRLTNFHVGPTCAPSRSGLLTGHYANSTGVWHTIGGRSLLRKNEWTLASALRENGYVTGLFGKWHLGDEYPYRPQDRGFDQTVAHGGGGIGQTPDYWGNDYFDDTYAVNGVPTKFTGYCTDVFFREALKFIENNRDRPFFCYLPTNAPHWPYNVDRRYSDLYKGQMPEDRAGFYGMITNIDENFALLRQKLREWNLEDNTILIFMTDNGTAAGVQLDKDGYAIDGHSAGLRGQKGSEYEGGHRVPFFIQWPNGGIGGGRVVDELTANVDFMPTLLDLCQIAVPEERSFHGVSLRSLLLGQVGSWADRVLVTDSQRLVYPVKWKQSCVMTSRWRLINGQELYDLPADREQRTDVADQYPDVVEKLRLDYEKWWAIVSEQFDEEIPILIGDRPTAFTSHDMRAQDHEIAWNQGQIRTGRETRGYWEIEIEQSGRYLIELRRWPREANHNLLAGIEGDDIPWNRSGILEKSWPLYTGGKALPLLSATISIQGKTLTKPIRTEESSVVFDLLLEKGKTHLQAWFSGKEGFETAAYYVYAERQKQSGHFAGQC